VGGVGLAPPPRGQAHQLRVTPIVAEARGYRSIRTAKELKEVGFNVKQRNAPGLLIPIWSTYGEIIAYQYRPDHPRIRQGKAVKYEFRKGDLSTIDVPPAVRAVPRAPTTPLFLAEGPLKADFAVSKGFPAIAIAGVYDW
jgi:hypothetical protein